MKPICFYHTDGDGYCSAAIVAREHGWDIDLRSINYGQPFPWEDINKDVDVIMVDFSLSALEMITLHRSCHSLIWIDHHESAIDAYTDSAGGLIDGCRVVGRAACELTWRYFVGSCYPAEVKEPNVVSYLGRYDVWDWQNVPNAIEFQYGFRQLKHADPKEPGAREFWDILLEQADLEVTAKLEQKIVQAGSSIYKYQSNRDKRTAKGTCFQTELCDIPFIACNTGGINSLFFDHVKDDFPGVKAGLSFWFNKTRWIVSLRAISDDCPNLADVAKHLGGGGHAGAAGFPWYSHTLPFEVPLLPPPPKPEK